MDRSTRRQELKRREAEASAVLEGVPTAEGADRRALTTVQRRGLCGAGTTRRVLVTVEGTDRPARRWARHRRAAGMRTCTWACAAAPGRALRWLIPRGPGASRA
jgi:hypothetical protein